MKRKKQLIFTVLSLLILALLAILVVLLTPKYMRLTQKIRPMAYAGQFYSAERRELRSMVANYLDKVKPENAYNNIKILIVPHAGYDYSAQVAAQAYQQVSNQEIKRVYLIGNSHRHYFSGIATDDSQAWETPLGLVRVDENMVKELVQTNNLIKLDPTVQLDDHILEVQLPFLQVILGNDFKIVPLLFGNTSEQDYRVLGEILSQQLVPGDLVIISSDMSHYPPRELGQEIDQKTLDLIVQLDLDGLIKHSREALDIDQGEETILCSLEAVKTALVLAENLQLRGQILSYHNSGDIIGGDKNKVVGYGAVIFYNVDQISPNPLNQAEQSILLNIARETVNSYVNNGTISNFKIIDERLQVVQGAFVTLHKNKELRGCIGEITANQPLWQVVQNMALEAASRDYRFLPVTADELSDLDYEISVLTPPQIITDWRQIRLGQDGVIIRRGLRSGVFLPQVAQETGWNLEEFLNQLCVQKAGLEIDCYKNDSGVEISIFQAQVFK